MQSPAHMSGSPCSMRLPPISVKPAQLDCAFIGPQIEDKAWPAQASSVAATATNLAIFGF